MADLNSLRKEGTPSCIWYDSTNTNNASSCFDRRMWSVWI